MPRWGNAKAIETVYGGFRFRSRLEAKWAVFFDALGMKYEYEPEGFDLDGTRYLPDFWLPQLDSWVEVKPKDPDEEEDRKARLLALHARKPVVVVVGLPMGRFDDFESGDHESGPDWRYVADEDGSNHVTKFANYGWAQCAWCDYIGFALYGRWEHLGCGCEDRLHGMVKSITKFALGPDDGLEHIELAVDIIQAVTRRAESNGSFSPVRKILKDAYLKAKQARFDPAHRNV